MINNTNHSQQTKREHPQQPWFTRQDLRLAFVTGLSAGIGLLSPIPYGYYLPLQPPLSYRAPMETQ